jgi:hypothetical protein
MASSLPRVVSLHLSLCLERVGVGGELPEAKLSNN